MGRSAVAGIHHVQLAMPHGGEAAARHFYSDLLGIPEVPKPPVLARRGGAWFETSTLRLHLGVEEDFRPAKKAHPGLLVEGLRGLCVRLREAGFEMMEAEPLDGYDHIYVHDPFGNRLEMLEKQP